MHSRVIKHSIEFSLIQKCRKTCTPKTGTRLWRLMPEDFICGLQFFLVLVIVEVSLVRKRDACLVVVVESFCREGSSGRSGFSVVDGIARIFMYIV